MNVIVCVKPVPGRELNPFDAYALEAAARLRDAEERVKIIALALAEDEENVDTLRRALAVAADQAVLVKCPGLKALDALGTSHLLARSVVALAQSEGECPLVFCGRQAPPEERGQVGAMLAGWLGWEQLSSVVEVEHLPEGLKVQRETERGTEKVLAALPCVVVLTKPNWEPRFPTVARSGFASQAQIGMIDPGDLPELGQPPALAVERLEYSSTPHKSGAVLIQEKTGEDSARALFTQLSRAGVV